MGLREGMGKLICLKVPLKSALTMLVWWQEGHPACKTLERGGAGVVTCLKQGARHSLSVASVKSRLVFYFSGTG